MDPAPFLAKRRQRLDEGGDDRTEIVSFEAVTFAQFWWSIEAIQDEYGFAVCADDVNMSGARSVG